MAIMAVGIGVSSSLGQVEVVSVCVLHNDTMGTACVGIVTTGRITLSSGWDWDFCFMNIYFASGICLYVTSSIN